MTHSSTNTRGRHARVATAYPHKQQGAALMVSLILIFAVSLMGISNMRSGSLDGRMVTNSIEKELTFQMAESGSDMVINDDIALESAICAPDPIAVDVANLDANGAVSTEAEVAYGGETIAIGYSLDSGFTAMRFSATGSATLDASGTTTTVTQGAYIIGAKSLTGGC